MGNKQQQQQPPLYSEHKFILPENENTYQSLFGTRAEFTCADIEDIAMMTPIMNGALNLIPYQCETWVYSQALEI